MSEATLPPALQAREYLTLALTRNPRILAARQEVERILAERDELRGFFDPQLLASAAQTWDRVAGQDSFVFLGGVEAAFKPGFYFDVTGQQGYLSNLGGTHANLGQTALTAQLRIPLWRDRGFRLWRLSDRQAWSRVTAARQRLVTAGQEVRRDVELEHISLWERHALVSVAMVATGRAEKLLAQAQDLFTLKVVPEYQLYPARLEVQLRRDDEIATREAVANAVSQFAALLGGGAPQVRADTWTGDGLIQWAQAAATPEPTPLPAALERRGRYQELLAQIEESELGLQRNREGLKSDVAIEVNGSWQGETAGDVFGMRTYSAERPLGAAVALTWRHPLGQRAERARIAQSHARIRDLQEQVRAEEIVAKTELQVATNDLRTAGDRLKLMAEAVTAARLTLDAEEERFRLGEGRSRNVLDAQRDLSEVTRRHTAVAAERLRAVVRLRYAAGYPGEPVLQPGLVPERAIP